MLVRVEVSPPYVELYLYARGNENKQLVGRIKSSCTAIVIETCWWYHYGELLERAHIITEFNQHGWLNTKFLTSL